MAQALLKLAPTDYPGQQPIPLRKVLAVKGLGKAYQSQQRVLDDINFDLHAGEFVAVIGRSGAGKSTLLHTLNGTIPSSCGEMLHFEDDGVAQDIAQLSARQMRQWRARCGMIFRIFAWFPDWM